MLNNVVQAGFFDNRVRVVCTNSTDIVKESVIRHDLSPMSSVILGRLLSASILLGSWMSEKERVTLMISTNDDVGDIVAQSNSNLEVKGYISNKKLEAVFKENGKFDVSKVLKNGSLNVIRDLGLKKPVVSNMPLINGEIAEDIAYYMNQSEQVPSAVSLGVFADKEGIVSAGGVMLQILDRTMKDEDIAFFEKTFINMDSISSLLRKKSLEDIIKVFGNPDYIEYKNSSFVCNCSKEKVLNSLITFNFDELEEMKKDNELAVHCSWCSKKYEINSKDLDEVINIKRRSDNA
ncbi:Hsp33 family molecular chaperone HslO [Oceanotoga sp. DSM 15011]|uniref:Hsp33 family molecular chaperone HslO n=1 Tax=Oceanotoga sp. DSM 15011 TaxID=2984951 RepID=UPI0021F3DE04|nr:Hsp33 family molecular chaperone HslO [Oceanotoga sp. DSM 15011]UYP00212.1 Hsp33 family molecular chaperone HslO [Oceanotoga sp. DSM 15011]